MDENLLESKTSIISLVKKKKASSGMYFFLVSYVWERPRWPIQCLSKGRKEKAKG